MKESDEMLSIFIIVFFVIIFTAIIIEIIGKRATRVGKHFAKNNDNKNNNLNSKNDSINTNNNVKDINKVVAEYEQNRKNEINKLRKQLCLFDMTIYDNLFSLKVREDGGSYYASNRIKKLAHEKNKYTCKVKGTKKYNVAITFSEENPDIIEEATCTCPYFNKNHKYCKHIYALLYQIKGSQNQDLIGKKMQDVSLDLANFVNNSTEYFRNNVNNCNLNVAKQYTVYSEQALRNLSNKTTGSLNLKTEDEELSMLIDLSNQANEIKAKIQYLKEKSKDKNFNIDNEHSDHIEDFDDDFDDEDEEVDSKTKLLDELAIYQMSNNLFNNNKDHKRENFSDYSEQDLADSGLEEWQKDEVRKGNWEPWSFDENDEFEDDDYYSDNGEDDD